TFNPTTRVNGSKPSEPATPILIGKATGQTFDRIQPDRAIVAQRNARSRYAALLMRRPVQPAVRINLVPRTLTVCANAMRRGPSRGISVVPAMGRMGE